MQRATFLLSASVISGSLRNNPGRPEAGKQIAEHLICCAITVESRPPQLAAVAKHVVIPAKNKISEGTITERQNIGLDQRVCSGDFLPQRTIILK